MKRTAERVKRKVVLELSFEEVVQALKIAGYIEPETEVDFVAVTCPGGDDWSHQDIEVNDVGTAREPARPLKVQYTETV